MDALTLLHSRNSAPKLCEPAPEGEALDAMFKAAFRAPDHAWLRPWRFLTIRGDGRHQLGQLFIKATQQRRQQAGEPAMTPEDIDKLAAKPLRAPLIITVIATIKEHPKVPAVEQVISAGCAAHGLLLAAHAQGFAGVWRTGSNAFDATVMQGLGLQPNEEIVGFLYLGSVDGNYKPLRELALDDFRQDWTAPAQ
ncbi:nitroreductase family protein [Oceanicoccus sagamiensis]|uniref:Putative NAD(P)H nitroreductase n=1 Tax=Oceanicoccus sagamiensis TaxID=716816 RepID=A0A1X9NDE2_9GAMM|nr:nitroreductase family protein [Oceanicoccus sagamiensis]ARN76068.1 nitroreductase [Oceanicoccus sagamiensis]